jgi:glucose/mannose-6-phosphate isomerase
LQRNTFGLANMANTLRLFRLLTFAPVMVDEMKQLIVEFSKHLRDAVRICEATSVRSAGEEFKNVVIMGLGGSGIGATITAELLRDSAAVPISVIKNYHIPAFVNKESLVIASSYSGNTEETLAALEAAMAKGATCAAITSGGRLLEIAKEKVLDHVVLPGGNPPRSMLGFSLTALLFLLGKYGIDRANWYGKIIAAADSLDNEKLSLRNEAKELARYLEGKMPVIYTVDGYEGVAVRFRQQINENGKMLCWHAVIPEMNHNELVGWVGALGKEAVVFLRNKDDYERNQVRIQVNKDIIGRKTRQMKDVWSRGENRLERMLYHIHLGDWCSLYLSELSGVDVMEVKVIDHLKSELGNV